MSLAMIIDAGAKDGSVRLVRTVGALMAGALGMAAWDQWQDGLAARHWLLPLGAALACIAWCLILSCQARSNRSLSLRIAPDGGLRLMHSAAGAEAVEAEVGVVMAWGLGRLVYLHLRANIKVDPASPATNGQQSASVVGSEDCRLLLARRSFSESDWHGLRRWLVWYRRSVHREAVVVQ